MINGKQRRYLKKLVHSMNPTVYIGKGGLTDNTLKEMDNYLNAHELVKVKVQEGCDDATELLANQAAEALKAEFVQAIGRKFSIYRQSSEKLIDLPGKGEI